tara:strand:+ start:387 stop:761 length:375 start_codon:yes stop_codon:yes gene_type:complete
LYEGKCQVDYAVSTSEYVSVAEVAARQAKAVKAKEQRQAFQGPALLKKLTGTMVSIPTGSLQMGSMHRDDEQPIHRVNINAFKMSEAKVNWAQYQPCVDAGVCPNASDQAWSKGERPGNQCQLQ